MSGQVLRNKFVLTFVIKVTCINYCNHGRSQLFDNEQRSEGMLTSENVINQLLAELFSIIFLPEVGRRQHFCGDRR